MVDIFVYNSIRSNISVCAHGQDVISMALINNGFLYHVTVEFSVLDCQMVLNSSLNSSASYLAIHRFILIPQLVMCFSYCKHAQRLVWWMLHIIRIKMYIIGDSGKVLLREVHFPSPGKRLYIFRHERVFGRQDLN